MHNGWLRRITPTCSRCSRNASRVFAMMQRHGLLGGEENIQMIQLLVQKCTWVEGVRYLFENVHTMQPKHFATKRLNVLPLECVWAALFATVVPMSCRRFSSWYSTLHACKIHCLICKTSHDVAWRGLSNVFTILNLAVVKSIVEYLMPMQNYTEDLVASIKRIA